MAGINLRGETSGSVEITSPAVAGDTTITLPNSNGTANQFFKNSTTAGIITYSSMVEDTSGNIGIGSTQPTSKFDITGNVKITGISTLSNVTVGGATTELVVNGDARVTGILTVGTASVTFNGTDGTITGINTINGVSFPSAGALSNRNLIINGAMRVAQRGTSSTSDDIQTVDRWKNQFGQGAVTQSQQALTSGAPYNEGFRYFARLQNTTATTANNSYRSYQQRLEGQDVATCGWDHTSSSSYITLSFWVRSSVAQTYYAYVRTMDGTERIYNFPFTLAADTWTKITETIPGNSSNQIDNDNGHGFNVVIVAYYGTDFTDSSNTDRAWRNRSNAVDYLPDMTNTWSNTTNATFDLTGVQIEVGEKATPFEHRSFGDELARCERYFEVIGGRAEAFMGYAYASASAAVPIRYRTVKRAIPGTITLASAGQSTGEITFLTAGGTYPSTTGNNAVEVITTQSFRVTGSSYSGLNANSPSNFYITGTAGQTHTIAEVDAEL